MDIEEENEDPSRDPAQDNAEGNTWWHAIPIGGRVLIVVALIGLIGVLFSPIIGEWAEEFFKPTPTNTPTPTSTSTPTPTPPTPTSTPTRTHTLTPSLTPTPECWNSILLNYSDLGGIGESVTFPLTSEGLRVDISNDENGSGVWFKFSPALDVRGFTRLELSGTSDQALTFLVEYKVLDAENQPEIVRTSSQQSFSGNYLPQPIKIPLQYDGTINELVINIPIEDEASLLIINSICFKK
jgi:hypothetical protein